MSEAPVSYRAGVLYVLASGLSFGCVGILGKLAFDAGYNVPSLLGLRWAVGAVSLALLLAALREPLLPSRRDLPAVAGLGVLGIGLTSGLYFVGLARVEAGVASVLLFTSPAMVAVLSVILGERLGWRGLVALGLSLAGVAFVAAIGRPAGGDAIGITVILAAAFSYAVYMIMGRRLGARVPPGGLAVGVMASAAVGFLAIAPFSPGGLQVNPSGWGVWCALGLGVVGSAVSTGTFFRGLPAVGAARASILSTVEPLSTLLLAALILQEIPTPLQLVGAACILGAVVLLAGRSAPPAPRPAVPLAGEMPQAGTRR